MHPLTASTYEYLAQTDALRGMAGDVIKAYTKAMDIFNTVLGGGHPQTKRLTASFELFQRENTANALNKQGTVLKAHGDLEKATQLFLEALDIYKEDYDSHRYMIDISENISDVKFEQDLLEERIAVSAEALKMRRRIPILGDNHIDTKRRMEAHRSLLKSRLLENRN
ncbi:unnamed protein product [Cylindrotheca closterium]|uniref:Kinesin light chain n=1 Tax=Cylindrotheca closterium TaxID=2856 RepID=A0AAD2CX20_9STRA|nr:unnamed protein product [Cylindrotheca closterium]